MRHNFMSGLQGTIKARDTKAHFNTKCIFFYIYKKISFNIIFFFFKIVAH